MYSRAILYGSPCKSEIVTIKNHLEPVFQENQAQIWSGDFNALTKEDYSESYWNNITEVRKRNCWESPKTELTIKVSISNFESSN